VLVTAVLVPLARLAVLCVAAAAPTARLLRLEALARPWAQLEILLLGLVVAFGKLAGVFPMTPGPGVGCLLGLLLVEGAAHRCLPAPPPRVTSPNSLRRTTAFLLAAALLFVPANLLPVMTTRTLLRAHGDTIASGVVALWQGGSPSLAVLVFAASIVVPALKILSLGLLVATASAESGWRRGARTRLYRALELVGRWSMLDVFVMAVLAALLRSPVAGVEIRAGALAFAAVVVLTMLSSLSFDPRLIWKGDRRD
jgi:paraquat-inducible protein A